MPNNGYRFDPNDGRIHTRYSELTMMTPGQVDRAMAVRLEEEAPFESEHMLFGTQRHDYFEKETCQTNRIPECYYELAGLRDIPIDRAERELALELVPGFVIHSRPDAYSVEAKTIFDYKTTLDGKQGWEKNVRQYRYSKQTVFYAMMLKYHGIEITQAKFLCEIWNADRDKILGYDTVEQEITPEKIDAVQEWTLDRLAMLKVALQEAIAVRSHYAKEGL